MRPRASRAALALAALLLPGALAAQRPAARPAPAPAAVARAFFAFHFAHDMGFDAAAVRLRRRFLADDLLALCRAYFARPDTPDEVPPVDGDPFTDSQEYPQGFRVGAARVAGDSALVPVTMTWRWGEERPVTLVFTRGGGAWRIADVRYREGPSLRALLVEDP